MPKYCYSQQFTPNGYLVPACGGLLVEHTSWRATFLESRASWRAILARPPPSPCPGSLLLDNFLRVEQNWVPRLDQKWFTRSLSIGILYYVKDVRLWNNTIITEVLSSQTNKLKTCFTDTQTRLPRGCWLAGHLGCRHVLAAVCCVTGWSALPRKRNVKVPVTVPNLLPSCPSRSLRPDSW